MFSDEPYNPGYGGASGSGVPLWVLPLVLLGVLTLAGLVRSMTMQSDGRVEPVPRQTSLPTAETAARAGG
jgi:hypothetical protein